MSEQGRRPCSVAELGQGIAKLASLTQLMLDFDDCSQLSGPG